MPRPATTAAGAPAGRVRIARRVPLIVPGNALYWLGQPVTTRSTHRSLRLTKECRVPPAYQAPFVWSPSLFALIEDGERQGDQLAVCVTHQGRHPYYLDGCQAIPLGLGRRERHAIYARSLDGATSASEPQLLEIDVQSMAKAFVTAIRAARDDRAASTPRKPAAPQNGALRSAQGPSLPPDDLGQISGVEVVRPDDGPT